jgi:predicted amidophosphoribosyltransferase
VVRELIARAKYRDERAAARWFLPHLVDAVGPIRAATDIVTWVPASAERLRGHGVDHGEVLARRVAAALGLPVMGLLDRSRSRAQTGLDARERRRGPPLLARCALDNASVLVVDDVTTTGGTLVAGARALRAHGARQIFAATIARTLHPAEHARDPAYTPSHQ